jgi:hypothetical protein
MKRVAPSHTYSLNQAIAIEDFGERSLTLHCTDLQLAGLNATARDIVSRLSEPATLYQVAAALAQDYGQPVDVVLADVQTIVTRMLEMGIVEQVEATQGVSPTVKEVDTTMDDTTLYTVNPDVSCREEGPDGALLFNPDTDEVLVINPTGLLIWQALAEPRSPQGTVEVLYERCNNVPESEVAQDVDQFIEQLASKGFISACQSLSPGAAT